MRRIAIVGGVGLLFVLAAAVLAQLDPAVPTVSRSSVWIDAVREGEMLRQVRGTGVLVPREIRWITAQTDARVDRIVKRPGAMVDPMTVLIEMSNPEVVQAAAEARYALAAAEAHLTEVEAQLRSAQLDQRAALAVARSEHESARLQEEAERTLAAEGVVPAVQHQRSKLLAGQLEVREQVEQDRLNQFAVSMKAQIAAQRALVDQARNTHELRAKQVESLNVRAGINGVLQQVLVDEGQRVALGSNIARVARPDELRAELRIAETQARDVQLHQRVKVDTRNGFVEGSVVRIDPAVQAGTVKVDVDLTGPLPLGARPDLSVDGTIEIERLPHVVSTGRPAYAQPNSTVSLFKVVDEDRAAIRVPVQLGRTSVNAVEIVHGLAPGDKVILSDTSAWAEHKRIHLN